MKSAQPTNDSDHKETRKIDWIPYLETYEMSEDLFDAIFDTSLVSTERSPVNHEKFLYRKDSIAIQLDAVFLVCVMYVDRYNVCNKNWKLRAYCAHDGCRKYLFTADYENPRRFKTSYTYATKSHLHSSALCTS